MHNYDLTEEILNFCKSPMSYHSKDDVMSYITKSKLTTMFGPRFTINPDIAHPIEMSIESLKGKDHYVLYSGGKESLLTCEILNFFGIEYKTIVFRESVKDIPKEVLDVADIVLGSEIIENYGNDRYGKHIPLIGYYISVVADLYPHSVIWVGAANVNEMARFTMGNSDHSDFTFQNIMKVKPIEVYSIVNCLSEIDIYRFVTKNYNYIAASSVNDCPDKNDRMTAFILFDEFMKVVEKIPLAERNLMFDWEVLKYEHPRLIAPLIYDFREDVMTFLNSMDALGNAD